VIVDSSVIQSLNLATDRAIPQATDTQLTVVPALVPTHQPLMPLSVLSVSNVALRDSFITESVIQKQNPNAAGSQVICTLAKGLWTVSINTHSAVIGTVGVSRVNVWRIVLNYQSFSIPLLRQGTISTAYTSMFMNFSGRFLLREDCTLDIDWLAPAAGEFTVVQANVQCERHL
jgi:hypothetical protein